MTDFGFSDLAQVDVVSQQRAFVGYSSLGYLAPELFRKDRRFTVSTDIYALGILLYELLVGRLPGRRSPLPSEVVAGLPKGVDELFELMACDDQAERIDSMAAVLRRVEKIRGLDGQANAVTLYLKPPVELPSLRWLLFRHPIRV